jgi:hypothetical protein
VAVEDEVVGHSYQPRDNVGRAVVEPDGVDEEEVDGEVDREADTSDQSEADQLQPVRGPAHAVKQTDMRPQLHDGGFLAHPVKGSDTPSQTFPLA